MSTKIDNYYNDFDPDKDHQEVMYRDGYTLQGRELNVTQAIAAHRLRRLADALFKDGDIVSDGQLVIDDTGMIQARPGEVYIKGAVRSVPAASFAVPVAGGVAVGVRLVEDVITELEDPGLYNPAVGSRGEGEPGAWRLRVRAVWGWDKDGSTGEFYPVWTIQDGAVLPKEAPPALDSFRQAIGQYDRDSTAGGSYVVTGMSVQRLDDTPDKRQVYTVAEGRARVGGYGVEMATARRITYAAEPDLRTIDTEVHAADGSEAQRIVVAHPPLWQVDTVRITRRKTISVVHGAYSGAQDNLPDTAVVSIVAITQGETTYTPGTDYKKTGDKVDWSPGGAEPAPGSTYTCTYDYIIAVAVTDRDAEGFTVSGAVTGTSIMVSYQQALPRIDRLALASDGSFVWHKGVASEYAYLPPPVPASLLPVASITQTWRPGAAIRNDAVRVVPFDEIAAINARVDYVVQEVSRQRLEADIATREAGARAGIFVDPLLSDDMRDQGMEQTAAIVGGEMTLPVAAQVLQMPQDITAPKTLAFTPAVFFEQPLRTGDMKVNPYMSFDPLPATVTLTPAVDFWTESQTNWASSITERITVGSGNAGSTSSSTTTQVVGSASSRIEHLRQITVRFDATGFGPGETLETVLFDGVEVTPEGV